MVPQLRRLLPTEDVNNFDGTFLIQETSSHRDVPLRYLDQAGWFHISVNNFHNEVLALRGRGALFWRTKILLIVNLICFVNLLRAIRYQHDYVYFP